MIQPNSTQPENFTNVVQAIAKFTQQYKAAEQLDRRRRLLVVGVSGSGKTYSACTTAKNPIILDSDDQMQGVPEDLPLIRIPVTNLEEARKIDPGATCAFKAVQSFLLGKARDIAAKFDGECTIIIDSLSTLSDSFAQKLTLDPEHLVNKFYFWKEWADGWRDFCTAIKLLKCNVIALAHEQPEYEGNPPVLSQYTWYLPGQAFSPRLASFFTDAVRQLRVVKTPKTDMQVIAFPDASVSGKPPACKSAYFWQLHPDKYTPWVKTRSKNEAFMIPADWNELTK